MTYLNRSNSSTLKSRQEAASYLNIKPNTLAVWGSSGRYDLPFVKIGRRVMYRLEDLDAFIARNTVSGGAIQ